jgi:hypothetical protein
VFADPPNNVIVLSIQSKRKAQSCKKTLQACAQTLIKSPLESTNETLDLSLPACGGNWSGFDLDFIVFAFPLLTRFPKESERDWGLLSVRNIQVDELDSKRSRR